MIVVPPVADSDDSNVMDVPIVIVVRVIRMVIRATVHHNRRHVSIISDEMVIIGYRHAIDNWRPTCNLLGHSPLLVRDNSRRLDAADERTKGYDDDTYQHQDARGNPEF